MAAQVFAPLFIVLITHEDQLICVNTDKIESFEPDANPKQTVIWFKNGPYMARTVKRPFQSLCDDLAAKNCK